MLLTLALALTLDTTLVLDRNDVSVESIAYDAAAARFFAGDVARGKILEIDRRGRSRVFLEMPGYSVLGIKLDRGRLWACLASADSTARNRARSALIAVDLATARLAGRWVPEDSLAPHLFNDLVVSPRGDVYLTDTEASRVYRLPSGGKLGLWFSAPRNRFAGPNGITFGGSTDSVLVAYADGILILTEAAGRIRDVPLARGSGGIDGLYHHRNELVGIDNGRPNEERVIAQRLNGRSAGPIRILERRHPAYAIPTTGVLVGDTLFYVANSQVDQVDRQAKAANPSFRPLVILRLPLSP